MNFKVFSVLFIVLEFFVGKISSVCGGQWSWRKAYHFSRLLHDINHQTSNVWFLLACCNRDNSWIFFYLLCCWRTWTDLARPWIKERGKWFSASRLELGCLDYPFWSPFLAVSGCGGNSSPLQDFNAICGQVCSNIRGWPVLLGKVEPSTWVEAYYQVGILKGSPFLYAEVCWKVDPWSEWNDNGGWLNIIGTGGAGWSAFTKYEESFSASLSMTWSPWCRSTASRRCSGFILSNFLSTRLTRASKAVPTHRGSFRRTSIAWWTTGCTSVLSNGSMLGALVMRR